MLEEKKQNSLKLNIYQQRTTFFEKYNSDDYFNKNTKKIENKLLNLFELKNSDTEDSDIETEPSKKRKTNSENKIIGYVIIYLIILNDLIIFIIESIRFP